MICSSENYFPFIVRSFLQGQTPVQSQNPGSHGLGREAGAAGKLPSASESCTRKDDGTTVGQWSNRGDSEIDRPSGRYGGCLAAAGGFGHAPTAAADVPRGGHAHY